MHFYKVIKLQVIFTPVTQMSLSSDEFMKQVTTKQTQYVEDVLHTPINAPLKVLKYVYCALLFY